MNVRPVLACAWYTLPERTSADSGRAVLARPLLLSPRHDPCCLTPASFFFFFLATYLAYVLLRWRWQNYLLLGASYLFYGAWDFRFLALLWAATVMDYVVGLQIEREHARDRPEAARRWLWVSLAGNLGMLGFFKYFNFFSDSLQTLAGSAGIELGRVTLDIVLPVASRSTRSRR